MKNLLLRNKKEFGWIIGASVLASATALVGCKMAPLQVIPQPRSTVATAPSELPKIPPPDPAAAQVPAGSKVGVVLSGLTYPSSVEFDSAGNMYGAAAGYVCGDESAPARGLRV